jgi:hypothetical protein
MLAHETLVKVRDALTFFRDGNKQFMLLVVSKDQGNVNFENIMIREASNVRVDHEIKRDPLCWQKIFQEFKFTSDIWE